MTTVVHDFNGHEVNGIYGFYGKKGYDEALYPVNKRHDITRIHDINGNFDLGISEVVLNVSAHLSNFFVKPTVLITIINFIIALI